jgi:hypothetical protein
VAEDGTVEKTSKLVEFESSAKIARYFCGVCGSYVLIRIKEGSGSEIVWKVCTGAVDGILVPGEQHGNRDVTMTKGRLERFVGHEFVGDTGDGGLAVVMRGTKGEEEDRVRYYVEAPEGKAIEDLDKYYPTTEEEEEVRDVVEDKLEVGCHCGGVRFTLNPPKEAKKRPFEACLCMCRSCRLSFGQPITAWAMRIPYDLIVQADGSIHYSGSLFGTLRRFQSSQHANRDFCGQCGASVFFHTTKRPGMLDIAMGLVQSRDGARAKSWFQWDAAKVHSPDDAVDEHLLSMVVENYGRL